MAEVSGLFGEVSKSGCWLPFPNRASHVCDTWFLPFNDTHDCILSSISKQKYVNGDLGGYITQLWVGAVGDATPDSMFLPPKNWMAIVMAYLVDKNTRSKGTGTKLLPSMNEAANHVVVRLIIKWTIRMKNYIGEKSAPCNDYPSLNEFPPDISVKWTLQLFRIQ